MAVALAVGVTGCTPGPTPSASPTAGHSTPSPSPSGTTTPSPTETSAPTPTSAPNPAPGQVVGLRAVNGGGSGEVTLTWAQNPESDIAYYIVYRALTPGGGLTRVGTFTRQQVTGFPVAPFVDSEAQVAYYRVRAVDTAGRQGPLSVEVCGASVGYAC